MTSQVRSLELFGCSGGMAEGFRRAGLPLEVAVDCDADACDAYAQNLGQRPMMLDVRELERLTTWMAPRHSWDLLVADPPCTPWSRAGKRRGLDDERDMLSVTARLIAAWKPRCWLIGNVPGLDDAPNVGVLQQVLGPLGRDYCIDYASLDAAAYGVPQHRVRPFWFGHPHGSPCLRWPAPTHGGSGRQLQIDGTELLPYVSVREALAHLSDEDLGKPIRVAPARTRHAHPLSEFDRPANSILAAMPNNCGNVVAFYGKGDHRPSHPERPARTLTRNTHSDGALLLHVRLPINRIDAPSYTITCKGDGRGAQGACAMEWPWERPSTTLTTRDEVPQCNRSGRRGEPQSWNAVKLSERAAAILQGFPEGWSFVGKTKRVRWSQLGQAMPPPLAAAIAGSIREWLGAQLQSPRCAANGELTVNMTTGVQRRHVVARDDA